MINYHYLNRYNKFIGAIKKKGIRNLEYKETHHIIPRCIGGTDDPINLIDLSLREHFLAHYMLAKAYWEEDPKLIFALWAMASWRRPHENKSLLNSRLFEQIKVEFYKKLKEHNPNRNMVNVYDKDGTKVRLTSEEYRNSNYKFHTFGMIYALNSETRQYEYITTEMFKDNDQYTIPKNNHSLSVKDNLTGKIISKLTYEEYWNYYDNIYYTPKLSPKKRYNVIKDFSNVNYDFCFGMIVVYDMEKKKNIKITRKEYNPKIHLTSSRNMVLAKDSETGELQFVDKDVYNSSETLVGQTKGLTTVFDRNSGQYIQISQTEFQKNRDRYQGPCTGKYNVININTGTRQQINKNDMNSNYIYLGNKK